MLFLKSRKGVRGTDSPTAAGKGADAELCGGTGWNRTFQYIPHRARGVESRVNHAGKDCQYSGVHSERFIMRQPGM